MNAYDQIVRYAAKADAAGFLRWLVPAFDPAPLLRGWLDTRTLPFPGEPDRVCDTVADLAHADDAAERWALVTEFQAEPNPEMLDRLLEYVARLRRELRHGPDRRGRYHVVAALVNLTGPPQPDTLEMALPADAAGLRLKVVVRTLRDEDAGATVAAIAAGTVTPILLVFVPLMRGGADPTIIERWKALALAEPDRLRRGMYGAFALILAGLADREVAWSAALEGWNVIESPVVEKWKAQWKAEGLVEGKRQDLLDILNARFPGTLPKPLTDAIAAQDDPDVLAGWLIKAAVAATLKEVRAAIGH